MIARQEVYSRKQSLRSGLLSAILVFGCLCLFSTCGKKKNEKASSTESFVMMGIDVSHHNPIPDWEKLKAEHVDFVFLKATEGTTHIDGNYALNYAEARQSTIKMGAYHFYSFGLSGREQARHFIETAQLQAGDLIPAIDVEHSAINPHSTDKQYVAKVIREIKELEDELYQYYGVHPLIYTNNNCYQLYIDGHFPNNLLWIVDLDKQPSSDIANWRIWQYSHMGRVAGIKGHVDLNYYRYGSNEFSELILPY